MQRIDDPALVRVGARVARTEAEGPGLRYALWLQGCSIRCPGCCNPHLFDPAAGEPVAVAALLEDVEAACSEPEIEGVTLLGGEPFDQAAPLVPFAEGVRARGLSLMAFSGYRFAELGARAAAGETAVVKLVGLLDVLVDGRYDAERPERERLWVGSSNQRFHYLTDRYSPAIERCRPSEPLRRVEVRLSADGRLSANGWPTASLRSLGGRVSKEPPLTVARRWP